MADLFSVLEGSAGPILLLLFAVVILLALLVLWSMQRVGRVERQYYMLTAGTEGGNLEEVLDQQVRQLREAACQMEELNGLARDLQQSGQRHIQHMGLVRYNPFRDTGGDQSFVLALADGDGNGTLLTSLHSREMTRLYAKPLTTWNSAYPLTDEEQEAVKKARLRI